MADLIHISVGSAAMTALLGYAVVFLGLVLLMWVLMLMGKLMHREGPEVKSTVPNAPVVEKAKAPGTAGELKLYDTDPRDAAMIMAIVADALGKPINELRFISIREVKDHEV